MFTFRSVRAWEQGHNIVVMTSDNPGSRLIEVVWEWDKQHINKIQEQPMNQISLIKRPTVQDAFQPILSLTTSTGMTGG